MPSLKSRVRISSPLPNLKYPFKKQILISVEFIKSYFLTKIVQPCFHDLDKGMISL